MKILKETYLEFIDTQILENSKQSDKTLQMKIPSNAFKFEDMEDLLTTLNDKYFRKNNVDLVIKISNELALIWEKEGYNTLLIERNHWSLVEGSFTYYRNELATKNNDKQNILILVGADLVHDSGSLEHLVNCDYKNIFNSYMGKNFLLWSEKFANSLGANFLMLEDIEKKNITKILSSIYSFYDIGTLAEYLDILVNESTFVGSGLKISEYVLRNLNLMSSFSCNIPVNSKFEKEFKKVIKLGESLFFEEISQESATQKRYCNKIKLFLDPKTEEEKQARLELDSNKEEIYPEFNDSSSFLNALISLINCSCDDEVKDKLRKCDFYYILEKILKLKLKKPISVSTFEREKFVQGSPFEMVLGALWDMINFVICKKDLLEEDINSIKIEGVSFKHNISSVEIKNIVNNIQDENLYVFNKLLKPVIGGLDDYFIQQIDDIFSKWSDGKLDFLSINLSKYDSYSEYKSSTNSIPTLKFKITINNFSKNYNWVLKDNNDFTLTYILAEEINNCINRSFKSSNFIPAFTFNNFDSCFYMQTEEDFKDEFISAIRSSNTDLVVNLLHNENNEAEDLYEFSLLANSFKDFVGKFVKEGIYAAINDSSCDSYINLYCRIINKINSEEEIRFIDSVMFLKAFWIIDRSKFQNEKNISTGILTLLHPTMLEELKAKNNYIRSYFDELILNNIQDKNNIKYNNIDALWDYCLELATFQPPIPGFFDEINDEICTSVKGNGLFFRMGASSIKNMDSVITTKFEKSLDNYISDENLCHKTQESKLICKQLKNFVSIHEYAQDGISISLIIDNPIQPVISGIINFVEDFFKNSVDSSLLNIYKDNPYQITLNVISTENNEFAILSWLDSLTKYWNNKALNGKGTSGLLAYNYSTINVSYNIISRNNILDFNRILGEKLDSDITIIYGNSDSSSVSIKRINNTDANDIRLKFPVLQKLLPKMIIKNKERFRMFYNPQFESSAAYIKLIDTYHRSELDSPGDYQVYLIERLQYSNLIDTLKKCHQKSEMVLCIGEDLDTELISNNDSTTVLIGFGSGIGSRAELNYTLSTQLNHFSSVVNMLSFSVIQLYHDIVEKEAQKMVTNLLTQKKKISDLSIFRAISNCDNNKHDFFAYMFTRRILSLPDNELIVCDKVISLDSYMHWYKFEDNNLHTDLIWIVVKKKKDERGFPIFSIDMNLIECKLGQNATINYAPKAYDQLVNTKEVLTKHFHNRDTFESDSKYWWMQLYRIIVSDMKLKQRIECPIELERLSEGVFELNWGQSIFVFDRFKKSKDIIYYRYQKEKNGDIIPIYEFGPDYVKKLSLIEESNIPKWQANRFASNSDILTNINLLDHYEPPILSINDGVYFNNDVDEEKNIIRNSFHKDPGIVTINNSFEIQLTDEQLTDEQLTDEQLTDEQLTDEQLTDEQLTDEQLTDEQLTDEQLTDEQLTDEQPLGDTRILLGIDAYNNKKYWDFGMNYKIKNRHIFVCGGTGSGKTYAVAGLLADLAKNKQASLVLDYNNGFKPDQINKYKIGKYFKKQIFLRNEKLKINPFARSVVKNDNEEQDNEWEESAFNVAERVAYLINTQFSTIGENQIVALREIIEHGIEKYGKAYSFDLLGNDLEDSKDKSIIQLKRKISPLIKNNPFTVSNDDYDWNKVFEGENNFEYVNTYQLANVVPTVQKLIIEFCLRDLWLYVNNNGIDEKHPKVIFLDEIQNLDLSDNSTLNQYMHEGRKFGLNIITATQDFSGIGGKNTAIASSLMQASIKLFFQPSGIELKPMAQIMRDLDPRKRSIDSWTLLLSTLKRGECYLVSETEAKYGPIKIKIPSMIERGLM